MRLIESLVEAVELVRLLEAEEGTEGSSPPNLPNPYHARTGLFIGKEKLKGTHSGSASWSKSKNPKVVNNQRSTEDYDKTTGKVKVLKTKSPCGAESRMRQGDIRCYDGYVWRPTKLDDPNEGSWYYQRKAGYKKNTKKIFDKARRAAKEKVKRMKNKKAGK